MVDQLSQRLRSFGAASGTSRGAANKEPARFLRLVVDDPGSAGNFLIAFFIGSTFAKGSVEAIMYDPHHPDRDENGHIEFTEEGLAHQLKIMDVTRDYREAGYKAALMAVQSRKTSLGIKRDTPLVVAETVFGKKAMAAPPTSPAVR